jgi:outer membrane protein assembly factor BamD
MTLEPRKSLRSLRLAAGLILLSIPLSGCGTGALWDKFLAKDDTFVRNRRTSSITRACT